MKDKNKIIEININIDNPFLKGCLYILSRLAIGIIAAFGILLFMGAFIAISNWLCEINQWLGITFGGGVILALLFICIEGLVNEINK